MSEKDQSKDMSVGPLGEISHAPPAFEQFLDRNQSKLIALAIALVIAAAGYVIYKGVKQGAEEEAGALLVPAEDMAGYQGVVKNHAGTAAAKSAKVLLADMQWEDGQEEDAIGTLRAFLADEKGHPGSAVAKASLATKLRLQGKLDESGAVFKELTEDANAAYLAPYAWISIGDLSAAKNDMEAAQKAYEQVEKGYAQSDYVRIASQRLSLMKAQKPTEVAPKIQLPDVKFDKEGDGVAPGAGGTGDSLIDMLEKGSGDGSTPNIPNVEEEKAPE